MFNFFKLTQTPYRYCKNLTRKIPNRFFAKFFYKSQLTKLSQKSRLTHRTCTSSYSIDINRSTSAILLILVSIFISTQVNAKVTEDYTFTPPPHLEDIGATKNVLFKMGYLDVTLYDDWKGNPVDSRGIQDSTVALQKALDDAHDYRLTAYFPSGTYLVSQTLHFVKKYTGGILHRYSTSLVGSTKGSRPIIKLEDNASGFDNPNKLKPVLAVWRKRGKVSFGTPGNTLGEPEDKVKGEENAQFSTGFLQRIQGIEIHCGSGNSGAVGLYFRAAQDSHVEDVKIVATDAFAGFYGLPSRTSAGAENIEVEGGKYGIYLLSNDGGSVIVGATLHNQTTAAIYNNNFAPVSVVGFDFLKNTGPVISISNGQSSRGTMNLLDGKVKLINGGTAFINPDGKNVYLRNIYVSGTNQLVRSKGSLVTGSGQWKVIKEYSHTQSTNSFNLIEGNINKDEIIDIKNNALTPPENLISQHTLSAFPSFEDEGIIHAADFGATGGCCSDDTKAIQNAIDAASLDPEAKGRVFLPKGEYFINDTLVLRSNTQLFGVARHLTWISTSKKWKPTRMTPMIQTEDDAKASTYLGYLTLHYRSKEYSYDWFNPIHWRAGRESKVVAVYPRSLGPSKSTQARSEFLITDNGGGRWYFMGRHQHNARKHPDYRVLFMDGTSEPFWFYGFNVETILADYQSEIRNSKNIRIFGPKVEGKAPVLRIHNAKNLALYGGGALRNPPDVKNGAYFNITGKSEDILLANINPSKITQGDPGDHTVRDVDGTGIVYPNMVAVYKRGTIDDTVMRSNSPGNEKPKVKAGPDQTISAGKTAILEGSVTDDSDGILTVSWSKVRGPGTVTFGDITSTSTTATFDADGEYVLQLSANDGELTGTDRVTVVVNPIIDNNFNPPKNLSARPKSSRITLRWNDVDRAQGYSIQWKTKSTDWNTITIDANVTLFRHKNLKRKTQYQYRIRADRTMEQGGSSSWSSIITVKTR